MKKQRKEKTKKWTQGEMKYEHMNKWRNKEINGQRNEKRKKWKTNEGGNKQVN